LTALPADVDTHVAHVIDNIRRWCRDAEQAVRGIQEALNETRAAVTSQEARIKALEHP